LRLGFDGIVTGFGDQSKGTSRQFSITPKSGHVAAVLAEATAKTDCVICIAAM
jgi:hypothetical protein